MRLYFELTSNTEPVPWDYQHFLIGTLHKWLGRNELNPKKVDGNFQQGHERRMR